METSSYFAKRAKNGEIPELTKNVQSMLKQLSQSQPSGYVACSSGVIYSSYWT